MTDPRDPADPGAELDPKMTELLGRGRPTPGAGFRGTLRRHLILRDPGYGPRPPALRAMATAYMAAAVIVFVIAALIALRAG